MRGTVQTTYGIGRSCRKRSTRKTPPERDCGKKTMVVTSQPPPANTPVIAFLTERVCAANMFVSQEPKHVAVGRTGESTYSQEEIS